MSKQNIDLQIEECKFVSLSTLLDGWEGAREWFQDVSEVTWGDADHTLVNKADFLLLLQHQEEIPEEFISQVEREVPDGVYVDMES